MAPQPPPALRELVAGRLWAAPLADGTRPSTDSMGPISVGGPGYCTACGQLTPSLLPLAKLRRGVTKKGLAQSALPLPPAPPPRTQSGGLVGLASPR